MFEKKSYRMNLFWIEISLKDVSLRWKFFSKTLKGFFSVVGSFNQDLGQIQLILVNLWEQEILGQSAPNAANCLATCREEEDDDSNKSAAGYHEWTELGCIEIYILVSLR